MNNKIKYLEYFWLIFGAILLAIAVYMTITKSPGESWIYYIFPVIAGFMYYVRRKQRKKMER